MTESRNYPPSITADRAEADALAMRVVTDAWRANHSQEAEGWRTIFLAAAGRVYRYAMATSANGDAQWALSDATRTALLALRQRRLLPTYDSLEAGLERLTLEALNVTAVTDTDDRDAFLVRTRILHDADRRKTVSRS